MSNVGELLGKAPHLRGYALRPGAKRQKETAVAMSLHDLGSVAGRVGRGEARWMSDKCLPSCPAGPVALASQTQRSEPIARARLPATQPKPTQRRLDAT